MDDELTLNPMKKSLIISTCLLNSGMIKSIDHGEEIVFKIYHEDNPIGNYLNWNTEINEQFAEGIIKNVGRAYRINVSSFIKDLT